MAEPTYRQVGYRSDTGWLHDSTVHEEPSVPSAHRACVPVYVAEPGEVSTTPDTADNTVPTDTEPTVYFYDFASDGYWPEVAT